MMKKQRFAYIKEVLLLAIGELIVSALTIGGFLLADLGQFFRELAQRILAKMNANGVVATKIIHISQFSSFKTISCSKRCFRDGYGRRQCCLPAGGRR